MIFNEIVVIGHENNNYCNANKSCDEIQQYMKIQNILNVWILKSQKKKKL